MPKPCPIAHNLPVITKPFVHASLSIFFSPAIPFSALLILLHSNPCSCKLCPFDSGCSYWDHIRVDLLIFPTHRGWERRVGVCITMGHPPMIIEYIVFGEERVSPMLSTEPSHGSLWLPFPPPASFELSPADGVPERTFHNLLPASLLWPHCWVVHDSQNSYPADMWVVFPGHKHPLRNSFGLLTYTNRKAQAKYIHTYLPMRAWGYVKLSHHSG